MWKRTRVGSGDQKFEVKYGLLFCLLKSGSNWTILNHSANLPASPFLHLSISFFIYHFTLSPVFSFALIPFSPFLFTLSLKLDLINLINMINFVTLLKLWPADQFLSIRRAEGKKGKPWRPLQFSIKLDISAVIWNVGQVPSKLSVWEIKNCEKTGERKKNQKRNHCTMQLSIEIRDSKFLKSKGPVFTQFCSKF